MPGIFLNILTEISWYKSHQLCEADLYFPTPQPLEDTIFLFHKEVEAQWWLIICLGLQA